MKFFAAIGAIGLVFLLCVCSGDPVKNTPILCEDEAVSCVCGKSGGNVTVLIKMCPSNNRDNGKICEPCDRHSIQCFHFSQCQTCQDGALKCTSCPRGKTGKFCAASTSINENRIVRQIGRKRHFTYQSETCSLPDRMNHSEFDCIIRGSSITCMQECNYGHRFSEEQHRIISCEFEKDVWKPFPVIEDCDYLYFPSPSADNVQLATDSDAPKSAKESFLVIPTFEEEYKDYDMSDILFRHGNHETDDVNEVDEYNELDQYNEVDDAIFIRDHSDIIEDPSEFPNYKWQKITYI